LQSFGSKYAELGGKRAGNKNQCVYKSKRDVQNLSVIRPEVWCTSFQAEVHRKEACEEHNLAAKPHNRAD
jgi:hypothetical protein